MFPTLRIMGAPHDSRLPSTIEETICRILRDKGFGIKFMVKGRRYAISAKVGLKTRIVGRFKSHNLIRGITDPGMIRGPIGTYGPTEMDKTCGWCRDYEEGNSDIKLDRIRGPVPIMTAEDLRDLMVARLST